MRREITEAEWNKEGEALFGKDRMSWAFRCPVCRHVATPRDWQKAGASAGEIAFSCVGRHVIGARSAFGESGPGPCNYAGGGLFAINPVRVTTADGKTYYMFEFAKSEDV